MSNKVSSDWLPSYIEATRPVLEIFKMAVYFPDRTHILAFPPLGLQKLIYAHSISRIS
jgi:hypothetical protein